MASEFQQPYFESLTSFVEGERKHHDVFPSPDNVFCAFRQTPLNQVRVLILGQDPYHGDGQAHGLSFSVRPGVRIPPSLRNIFQELQSDLDLPAPADGCLDAWANQGVLLLNTVLTVRAHEANSHRRRGWETFTDSVIKAVNDQPAVVFVLWGRPAQQKASLIDDRHLIVQSPHPSPLSARRGFFGSRPFSQINAFLAERQLGEIHWDLRASAAPGTSN